jgi:hypothetical protein
MIFAVGPVSIFDDASWIRPRQLAYLAACFMYLPRETGRKQCCTMYIQKTNNVGQRGLIMAVVRPSEPLRGRRWGMYAGYYARRGRREEKNTSGRLHGLDFSM